MNKRIIFMFAGQGAQYYQMGKELYEKNETFKYWMDHCDKIVAPMIQTSLIDELYRGKKKTEPFDNILYTTPALLCIEYSLFQVLREMGIQPDFLLGYSLGEIIAAVVSAAISLEDGIRLLVDMARLLAEKTPQAEMLAIIAPKTIMTEFPDLFSQCWITGTNFHNNFVVGGLPFTIQQLQAGLHKENIVSQLLPVRYGFHSKLIDPIKEACQLLSGNIKMLPNTIPIISSLTGEVIPDLSHEHLWEAIRYPVNFERTVSNTLENGDFIFIDLGPSGSLATLVKYILPAGSVSTSIPLINQFGRDLEAMERLRVTLAGTSCTSKEY
jgi:bacillaene synthase trans-acting acyltransferase